MSCEKCDARYGGLATFFYRWKNANIEIRACDDHLKEVLVALNAVQEKLRAKPEPTAVPGPGRLRKP